MKPHSAPPISPEQAIPRIQALLEQGLPCHLTVTGSSMRPFLRDKRDAVLLAPPKGEPRPGDILFYLRSPTVCILHRVHALRGDGTLLMCGDAQTGLEPIRREQILGVVSHIKRDGKAIACSDLRLKTLTGAWRVLRPVRPYLLAVWNRLER